MDVRLYRSWLGLLYNAATEEGVIDAGPDTKQKKVNSGCKQMEDT